MIVKESMTLMEKLNILSDAAKYDVACTSSGTNRRGDGTGIGNSIAAGDLSQLCRRWTLHQPFESAVYQ